MADGTVGRLGQTDGVIRGDEGPTQQIGSLGPDASAGAIRVRGTMLWFNAAKDLGALRTDDGKRMDVLGTAFLPGEKPAGRCAGELVEFGETSELFTSPKNERTHSYITGRFG